MDSGMRPSRDPGLLARPGLRSLLVPIDLTPSSDRILRRVSRLPLADGLRLTLLHVVPGSLRPRDRRNAERDANKALEMEARQLRQLLPKNASIESLVRIGSPAKEISASATKVNADLIVMGRGKGRALRDAFLGSTAERVIRQAQLPVLVVRLATRAIYSRPALALDLDPAAHEVVRVMLLALSPPHVPVAVIHAFDDGYRSLVYPSFSDEAALKTKSEAQVKVTRELARLLAAALTEAKVPPEHAPSWRIYARHGSPRLVIREVITRIDADLLVLGTHGYAGLAYIFLGTVAGDLLRGASCDVLVVPPVKRRRRGRA